jgi:hypothetical protein
MVKQFERQRDGFLEELSAQPYEGFKPS